MQRCLFRAGQGGSAVLRYRLLGLSSRACATCPTARAGSSRPSRGSGLHARPDEEGGAQMPPEPSLLTGTDDPDRPPGFPFRGPGLLTSVAPFAAIAALAHRDGSWVVPQLAPGRLVH